MNHLACLVVAVLALLHPHGDALAKDCPPTALRCPTGELFKFELKYNSNSEKCESQESVRDQAWAKCPKICNVDLASSDKKAKNEKINEEWRRRADGCSAPLPFLANAYNNHFRGACDLHDRCYASLGHTKDQCDQWEHDNAKAICKWSDREKRDIPDKVRDRHQSPCERAADEVYVVMKGFPDAKASFDNGQNWAKSHQCEK